MTDKKENKPKTDKETKAEKQPDKAALTDDELDKVTGGQGFFGMGREKKDIPQGKELCLGKEL